MRHSFINLYGDTVQAQKEINRMINFVEDCKNGNKYIEFIKFDDFSNYIVRYLQKYFNDKFTLDAIYDFLSIKATCKECYLNSYCLSNIQDLINTCSDYKVVYLPTLLADLKERSKQLEHKKLALVSFYYDLMDEMKRGQQL